ncbi:MAG: plasmid maintenance system antidote protein [Bacteroidota bacterium]
MLPKFSRVKGIHPGAILKRELKKRKIKSVHLAKAIDEYPQTINAITKERRGVNPKLSLKLGDYFHIDQDYFSLLQASYEVKQFAKKQWQEQGHELVKKARKTLFWDTEIANIDWDMHKRAIIQRFLEWGNVTEIESLIQFYGLQIIKCELAHIENTFSPHFEENVKSYILNP